MDKGGDEKPSLAPSLVPEHKKHCCDDVDWILLLSASSLVVMPKQEHSALLFNQLESYFK